MTDEQINAAIAEACGITQPDQYGTLYRTENGWGYDCPNYCNDLNAMHEAERALIAGFEDEPESSELWSDFQTNLIIACPAYLSYHATARQRAEAFLRTIGKWEEVLA